MSEKYSYSKLDKFLQCPFAYYLKYKEGHYVCAESLALELGTTIHAIEEAIANSIKAGETINYLELKSQLRAKMAEFEAKYDEAFLELDKSGRTCKEKIADYLDFGIYRLESFLKTNPTLEIVGAEIPFELNYNGHLFKGFIDRVFKDNLTGKYIIQDIKTYAEPLENSKLKTPLQFVIYTLAGKELFKCDSNNIICQYDLPFCNKTQTAQSNFLQRGIEKLDQIFLDLTITDYKSKPSALCHWCEFCATNSNAPEETRYLCPYFCKWTKQNKNMSVENKFEGLENHKYVLEMYHRMYGIKLTEEVKK